MAVGRFAPRADSADAVFAAVVFAAAFVVVDFAVDGLVVVFFGCAVLVVAGFAAVVFAVAGFAAGFFVLPDRKSVV